MKPSSSLEICRRIAKVRLELAGPRGKSSFAKQLGLSPSTYDYYESTRVPPAGVLVQIADLAGVDLRWLLTGEESGGRAVPASHPVLRRAADLLASHPNAAASLAAFLDILSESMKFPAKQKSPGRTEAAEQTKTTSAEKSWIPILGRSAAGVPQFWSDSNEAKGLTTLRELIERHTGKHDWRTSPAGVDEGSGRDATVEIITLSEPDEKDTVEFIAAGELKSKYGDAFAVRIDGESMAPDIRHGDLVILSPSVPAAQGKAAVVQLRGQIGVTCKLYRREGNSVHLVPINEQLPPQKFPAKDVLWALRVLARVRQGRPISGRTSRR